MSRTDLLTATQEQVLALIVAGSTARAAAESAGVHRNTVANWQRSSPAFRKALNQASYDQALYWRDQAQQLAAAALDTIFAMLTDSSAPSGTRVRAALAILDRASAPLPLSTADYPGPPAWRALTESAPRPVSASCDPPSSPNSEIEPVCASNSQPDAGSPPERGPVHNLAQLPTPASSPAERHSMHNIAQVRVQKPGRNEPCPCGSGRKFKHCCLSQSAIPAALSVLHAPPANKKSSSGPE